MVNTPYTRSFVSFWGTGSQAASLTFIPGSLQVRQERVESVPQHPRVRLVPPKERAAGVRFYQVRQLWAV